MPERSGGGWTVYGERVAYDDPRVRIGLLDVESPGGERFDHHVVELTPIAIALIVNDRDEILLLWKYRFVTDQWGYEMPGGLVDDGETAASAAAREVVEETGWSVSGEPEHLLSLEPLPGQVRARTDVYLWRGATHVGTPTDPDEAETVIEWTPVDRIPELVRDGKVLGSSTSSALLYYHALSL